MLTANHHITYDLAPISAEAGAKGVAEPKAWHLSYFFLSAWALLLIPESVASKTQNVGKTQDTY